MRVETFYRNECKFFATSYYPGQQLIYSVGLKFKQNLECLDKNFCAGFWKIKTLK